MKEMDHCLYSLMILARNASRWKMGLLPCCKRCSKYAACNATLCLRESSIFRSSSVVSRLKITSAGMQLISSSYNLPRTVYSIFGVCSFKQSPTISWIYSSQSARATGCPSEKGYCCTRATSRARRARRKSRPEVAAMREARALGRSSDSFLATAISTSQISADVGALTRTHRQRLRTGSMTREALLQHSTRRQAAEYFSIVRRRLCCASRLRRSTSLNTSTLKLFFPFESMGLLRAISLMISCTT
mmetsp:Transcript_9354/g.28140  ORF Transcript_9354/g.28140 Transcript_9354/m.28140 type:complete len:246 (-) Transcript_9354:604-1341(-)